MTNNERGDNECIDYKDEQTLRRLYYEEELSTNDIAELAGVTGGTIRNWMDKFDLERRDNTEAAAMKNRVQWAAYSITKDGYPAWRSSEDGYMETVPVHTLLAIATGESPAKVFSPETEVHHKIPIPFLNTPDNLEVLSKGAHRTHHNQGESHHRSKVSDDDVRRMRQLSERGLNSFQIAEQFDISPSAVRYAIRGDNWSHVD